MTRSLRLGALALLLGSSAALAQQADISIGMVLEPPNLDPTGGAAAAIDEVVYANVFEGLTVSRPMGRSFPASRKAGRFPRTASPTHSRFAKVSPSTTARR
jgi:peptide/nickel transport system substrate-binding protein